MAKKSVKKLVHGDGIPSVGKNFERLEGNTLVKYIYVEKPYEVIKEVMVDKIVEKIIEKPVELIKEVLVEKIVPYEVIKEIPVERIVIKEIEVTKEVPVEKVVEVIKEVPVTVEVEKLTYKTPMWVYGLMAIKLVVLAYLLLK